MIIPGAEAPGFKLCQVQGIVMQKKLIATAFSFLVFAFFSAAFAQTYKGYKGELPCPPVKKLKDELYVGVSGGYDAYRIRDSFSVTDITSIARSGNPVLSANGWNGGLFVGYGRYFGWFYIAGEIFANYTGAQTSTSFGPYNNSISLRTSWGGSLLPGIKLNDQALLYARIGFVRTFLQSTEKGVLGGNSTDTNWENGGEVGIGLETLLIGNLSLRAEYNHIFYTAYTTPFSTRLSPSNNQFLLGLNYHFDPFE